VSQKEQPRYLGVTLEERYMRSTAEYPMGSYLRLVDGKPEVATGWYEHLYPGHPSFDFHKGPPFIVIDTSEWKW
jgi:hypothetical protein